MFKVELDPVRRGTSRNDLFLMHDEQAWDQRAMNPRLKVPRRGCVGCVAQGEGHSRNSRGGNDHRAFLLVLILCSYADVDVVVGSGGWGARIRINGFFWRGLNLAWQKICQILAGLGQIRLLPKFCLQCCTFQLDENNGNLRIGFSA